MFYDQQPKAEQQNYKEMLGLVGQLSNVFSESKSPYLVYRAHENIFCKYFEAENLARDDDSADAVKGNVGIGLKTWVGTDNQKVAEFGKLLPEYKDLSGYDLVKKIAYFRNERIRVTKNMHGIETMVYHVVKRVPGKMQIYECSFDPIDIDHIVLSNDRGDAKSTYFTDGRHTYHFSDTKHTLYMNFDDMKLMDEFAVDIIDDPYNFLAGVNHKDKLIEFKNMETSESAKKEQLCLPLYSRRGKNRGYEKFVAEKSGLNQWNAGGRKRNPNELYIPFNTIDKGRNPGFFPGRDVPFSLHLPDGKMLKAKVCQENDKAIMSNPNKDLGKWLLRDVLELKEGTLINYQMLETFGIDSVVFTKNDNLDYSIEFAPLGTYEKFYPEMAELYGETQEIEN